MKEHMEPVAVQLPSKDRGEEKKMEIHIDSDGRHPGGRSVICTILRRPAGTEEPWDQTDRIVYSDANEAYHLGRIMKAFGMLNEDGIPSVPQVYGRQKRISLPDSRCMDPKVIRRDDGKAGTKFLTAVIKERSPRDIWEPIRSRLISIEEAPALYEAFETCGFLEARS